MVQFERIFQICSQAFCRSKQEQEIVKSGIFFVTTFFKIEITPSKRRRMVVNQKAKLTLIDLRIKIRRHF